MRKLATALLASTALLATALPAQAVTDGSLDEDAHPYVGIMVAFVDGDPAWRCTGTLLSPTLFLTAGHCTDGAESAQVWFDADVSDREASGYPFTGDVSGVPFTHPDYDPDNFSLRDLGVVVLDEPVELDSYAELPDLGALDELKPGRKSRFTSVGYGMQEAYPEAAARKDVSELVRMVAHPQLLQINRGIIGDYALLLSNNANTGGTCFGDSGGPNFIGDSNVLAGVTSFGMNATCAGTGGVFRVDTAYAQDWLYDEFGDHLS